MSQRATSQSASLCSPLTARRLAAHGSRLLCLTTSTSSSFVCSPSEKQPFRRIKAQIENLKHVILNLFRQLAAPLALQLPIRSLTHFICDNQLLATTFSITFFPFAFARLSCYFFCTGNLFLNGDGFLTNSYIIITNLNGFLPFCVLIMRPACLLLY